MVEKRVSVRLVAEGGRLVRSEFQGVGEAGEASFKRIEKQADITGKVVRRVMGVLGAAISVQQLVTYTNTWTDLRSRVDLATGSQEKGAAVMERLAAMARRTYSGIEQTTESWLANATALRELGLSTRESLEFTEALNNAMVVSGAKGERAASVQNALSKAMALGKLSGDNLNTVIASGGRVAELLAAELGVNVNQLRSLGAEGTITGDVIRRALVGNLEHLREEADSMPATIGDAFTLLSNAVLQLVGGWDTNQPHLDASVLVRRVADHLGCRAFPLHAPAVFDSAEVKRAVLADSTLRTVVDMWHRVDVAVITSGGPPDARANYYTVMDRTTPEEREHRGGRVGVRQQDVHDAGAGQPDDRPALVGSADGGDHLGNRGERGERHRDGALGPAVVDDPALDVEQVAQGVPDDPGAQERLAFLGRRAIHHGVVVGPRVRGTP